MQNKLQILSDNNIHFTIESYYDIGFTVYFGDRFNGIANYKSFQALDDGINWLWEEAKRKNPELDCFSNQY